MVLEWKMGNNTVEDNVKRIKFSRQLYPDQSRADSLKFFWVGRRTKRSKASRFGRGRARYKHGHGQYLLPRKTIRT